jgi:endonuclease-3
MANGAASDLVGHFKAGLDVLKRYPTLVIPPLAVQVAIFVLALVLVGGVTGMAIMGGMAGGLAGLLAGGALLMLVGGLLSLIASGVVVVMARDALAAREPAIGEALGVVTGRLGDVLIASILLTLIVGIGMVLFVIPGRVAAFFLVFTQPEVLLGNQGAVAAHRRSAALVSTTSVPWSGSSSAGSGRRGRRRRLKSSAWSPSSVRWRRPSSTRASRYLTVVGPYLPGPAPALTAREHGAVAETIERRRSRARQLLRHLGAPTPMPPAPSGSRSLELLVATILAAQCTDERVNQVTEGLFRTYRTAADYARADPRQLRREVHATGFFRAKTRAILGMARALLDRHEGEVPGTLEALTALPGVGRKTANVVLGNAFGVPGIAVDTHVFRVTQRLGLAKSDDPDRVEAQLAELLPRPRWTRFCT